MAKVILGKRPKQFNHPVDFNMPGGDVGRVNWQFVYRTRTEFGQFIDTVTADAGVPAPRTAAEEDVRFSLEQAMAAAVEKNATYILKIANGWDLDVPFDLAHVQQFCDELPGGAAMTMEAYRQALTEGRLGN